MYYVKVLIDNDHIDRRRKELIRGWVRDTVAAEMGTLEPVTVHIFWGEQPQDDETGDSGCNPIIVEISPLDGKGPRGIAQRLVQIKKGIKPALVDDHQRDPPIYVIYVPLKPAHTAIR